MSERTRKQIIRYFLILLAIALCTIFITACGDGEDTSEPTLITENGLFYEPNEDGASYGIVGTDNTFSEIEIPSYICGLPVTAIRENAFAVSTVLTSVIIPDTVTLIGERAFAHCSLLKNATIGNGVTHIGRKAFIGCDKMRSVTLGGSVTHIGKSAFTECRNLSALHLPDSVTKIDQRAFAHCTGLLEVEFGSGLKQIGQEAFYQCERLAELDLNDGLEEIGTYAFSDCSRMKVATIPKSISTIGAGAFSGCRKLLEIRNLSSLNIEPGSSEHGMAGYFAIKIYDSRDAASAREADEGGFVFIDTEDGCYLVDYTRSGTTVTLPENYKGKSYSIFRDAFFGISIGSLYIPSGIKRIGKNAFVCPNGPKEVHIEDIGEWCAIEFGNWDSNPLRNGAALYVAGQRVTELVIPDTVTHIGAWAFSRLDKLSSVKIPSSVRSIGDDAFTWTQNFEKLYVEDLAKWCEIDFESTGSNPLMHAEKLYVNGEEVSAIALPEGISHISDFAFYGCTPLTSVTLPDSLKIIGEEAFSKCKNLTGVSFGSGTESIGCDAFLDCTELTEIRIPGILEWCKISFENPNSNPLFHADVLYEGDAQLASAVIPWEIAEIKPYAFYGFSGITSLTVSEVTECIGAYSFANCESLTAVKLGEGVKTICDSAFYKCTVLKRIELGRSLSTVEKWAFSACGALEDVFYAGSAADWAMISISWQNDPLTRAKITYAVADV